MFSCECGYVYVCSIQTSSSKHDIPCAVSGLAPKVLSRPAQLEQHLTEPSIFLPLITANMAHAAEGQESAQYHAVDAIGETMKGALTTGGAGLFISTIQNTLTKQNIGMAGIFTRTGGTVATYGEFHTAAKIQPVLTYPQLQWELHTALSSPRPPTSDRPKTPGTAHTEDLQLDQSWDCDVGYNVPLASPHN